MASVSKAALLAAAQAVDDLPQLGIEYTRYSTEEQGSTAEQRAINAELAEEAEVELVASFGDEGLSRSLSGRPGLLEAFAYLEEHPEVRWLFVNEWERLTAGIAQRQQITALTKRLNITIVTEDMGTIRPHDEEQMQLADERSVASQREVVKIRRRTRRNLRTRVSKGRSVVMRPCYGIRMVPLVLPDGTELPSGMSMIDGSGKRVNSGQIEIHPDEYPWLVKMFNWSAEGLGLGEIARKLNEKGVRTKSGKGQWSSSTVVGILDNTFYTGEMTWGLQETRRDETGKKYTVVRRKGDPGRVDMKSPLGAIIDPEVWNLAKSEREKAADLFRPAGRERQPRQVLDGRVYCLRCGHKMYGRNNSNTAARKRGAMNWAYVCHSSRPAFQPRPGFPKCTRAHTMSVAAIFEMLAGAASPNAQITVVHGGVASDLVRSAKDRERERIEKAQATIDRAEDLALEGDISKEKLRSTRATQMAIIVDAERHSAMVGETREVEVEPIQTAVVDHDGLSRLVSLVSNERLPLAVRIAALDDFGLEELHVDKPFLRLKLRD